MYSDSEYFIYGTYYLCGVNYEKFYKPRIARNMEHELISNSLELNITLDIHSPNTKKYLT